MPKMSEKSIERLILYRRLLLDLQPNHRKDHIYSHELAKMTSFTPAQIRRDIMAIGYSGSPVHGYDLKLLLHSISEFIDAPEKQEIAIVGLGHLGRALLNYFHGRNPNLEIAVVFDSDPKKINRVIHGVQCYNTSVLEQIIQQKRICVGIIAVPVEQAQDIAERLVRSGIKAILNFAPVRLQLPPEIYIENSDMILAVEKAAFFARKSINEERFNE